MALINCPKCGQAYSDKAKECPHCGYSKNKKWLILVIVCLLVLVVALAGILFKHNIEKQKIAKQEKIQFYLDQVDEDYNNADFEGIEKSVIALDNLGYDTSAMKKVLEYDKKIYPEAVKYYTSLKEICENVDNGQYESLKDEYYKLKDLTNEFDKLEINTDSRIGQWMSEYKKSGDYVAWKVFITGDYIDTVEITSFTEFIPVSMLRTVAGPLLRKDFPIAIKEDV